MRKRQALFVDDDSNIIDGVRSMLRRQRGERAIQSVSGGPAALAKMASWPFAVVYSPPLDRASLDRIGRTSRLQPWERRAADLRARGPEQCV